MPNELVRDVTISKTEEGVVVTVPSIFHNEPAQRMVNPNMSDESDLNRLIMTTSLFDIITYFVTDKTSMYPSVQLNQEGLLPLSSFLKSEVGQKDKLSDKEVIQILSKMLEAIGDGRFSVHYRID